LRKEYNIKYFHLIFLFITTFRATKLGQVDEQTSLSWPRQTSNQMSHHTCSDASLGPSIGFAMFFQINLNNKEQLSRKDVSTFCRQFLVLVVGVVVV